MNRISINNYEANKNIKILHSKSKLENNKYIDLFLNVYSVYKKTLLKKTNGGEKNNIHNNDITIIEETDENEENLDKIIASRVRSRGIGFSKYFELILFFYFEFTIFSRNKIK